MSWLLPRLLAGLSLGFFGLVVGGLAGLLLSDARSAVIAALVGCIAGLAVVVALDSMRGWRLLRWLRGPQQEAAPRDSDFWGEIAYRIERNLRGLRDQVDVERTRLAQFVSAMQASPNGVLLLDSLDQIEWCNARAADHFGLDPERDKLQRVTNLVRSPAFVELLQGGNFDEPVVLRDPRRQGSLQVLVRRYGADSKLVLSQDLTERERADAMRRDFVANVSHEIRTPLTVLSGFLETMRNLPLTDVEQRRVLKLMSQQAERMGNLVSDLLTLARLEGGPRPAADHWIPVAPLFAQAEAEARALSAGRHVIVFAEVGDVELAGTESELHSAIANLVNNAVRYTPDGGRIDVTWRIGEHGSGELSVVDSGRGIPREHLSRLTERFYRVDGSRSRESGGTGLGLAIVKHVIQRHGGELDIASEPGKGSTFRLLFPAARVRAGSPSPVARAALSLR